MAMCVLLVKLGKAEVEQIHRTIIGEQDIRGF